MKLCTLGVPYTRVSRDILLLHSRAAVLEMLKLYGGAFAPHSLQRGTPYSRRVQRESLAELTQRDLVSQDDKGTLTVNAIPPHKTAEVPTQLPWDTLSLAEAGEALRSLAVKGICTTKIVRDEGCRWTRGTLVQLLDTRSGAPLNDLAWLRLRSAGRTSYL